MIFQPTRKIDRLALPITRECNRHCPECMARSRPDMSLRERGPVSVDELKWVGRTLGPIGRIEITGGEPSLHPDFVWISEHIHELFQCPDIMLLTNGFLFQNPEMLPLLLNYDRVYVTHYTPTFALRYAQPPNTQVVHAIKKFLRDHPKTAFWEQSMSSHSPKDATPVVPPSCFYYTCDSIAYHRGQLYGCCTAWQLDHRGRGILLTTDWRNHLNRIDLPCETCFLSGT